MVQHYTRAYLWYVISRTLFADGGGRTAPWMWLKALSGWDSKQSWGSAALAYLYRQLDEACCRHKDDASIGGPLVLLSVWMWEHFSVGRPKVMRYDAWDDHDNPLRKPTWAYKWDKVSEFNGDQKRMYIDYTNEFDALTAEQVTWQPYGPQDNFTSIPDFQLNPKCTEESHLWQMRCPLICLYAVERHLPQRVMTQFGLFQDTPPEWKDTNIVLHGLDKMKQKKIKNWESYHEKYIKKWNYLVKVANNNRQVHRQVHDEAAFYKYLQWFLSESRVELCPPAYDESILEVPTGFVETTNPNYNRLIREGTQTGFAPMINFMRTEISRQVSEADQALAQPRGGNSENALREFIKRSATRLHSLAHLLGCRIVEADMPTRSSSTSSEEEAPDEITLRGFIDDAPQPSQPIERRHFNLKPRKTFNRYTPEAWNKKQKRTVDESVVESENEFEDEEEPALKKVLRRLKRARDEPGTKKDVRRPRRKK
ncbi:serine/threonine-protein phosphatase 7 long form homolog isoform X1 [Aegilops tauschii subsp. strangulata]|uniref:serine/threonine-protein phosphatase 7 long form homolog isoform X1 n=1 Tax=Aegilops tauschii subsp. strangulata TaxID=200361 RepID=UPI000989D99B|nr:serine/threonine-protein phosphatase 7 long form homolog isoform X1 [Aegilops tauschii subsp. strangulata]XP_020169472.1 serine/threonine-protein phosphatase 7 long form homolog isoform X1 [Aegilops tauschii subsp. strangulata]XP_045087115.1 serine/threonine-protein phosphatase 7 long form homolog isoform X1 [Aegilops tauschii subsp. strangulata]